MITYDNAFMLTHPCNFPWMTFNCRVKRIGYDPESNREIKFVKFNPSATERDRMIWTLNNAIVFELREGDE